MDTLLAAIAVVIGMDILFLFFLRIAGLYPWQHRQESSKAYDDGLMRIVGAIGFFFLILGTKMLAEQFSPEMVDTINWLFLLALFVLVFGIRSGLYAMKKANALPREEEQGL